MFSRIIPCDNSAAFLESLVASPQDVISNETEAIKVENLNAVNFII